MSFGKKLEQLLAEKRISKNAFAKKINISQTSISNYIKDISEPSISVIRSIKKAYPDVDLHDFLEIDKDYRDRLNQVRDVESTYNETNYREKYEIMYEKYLKAREDAILAKEKYLNLLEEKNGQH